MRIWKVILAAAVIFGAGFLTGGVGLRQALSPPARSPLALPPMLREEYVQFVARELNLSPQQREAIAGIVDKSQERVRILYDLISPDLREELRFTREEIKAQLTPGQREKFEQLPPRRPRGPGGPLQRDARRGPRSDPWSTPDPSSNSPASR